jgi:hypothetical protein
MVQSNLIPAHTRSDGKGAARRPTRPEHGQEHNNLWLATINSSRNTQLRTRYGKYLWLKR